jgi:hypothetical protein
MSLTAVEHKVDAATVLLGFYIQAAMHAHPDVPVILPETSSHPSDIPQEQMALFQEVLRVLEANKVAYAVSGAIALQEHTGICRETKDLDVFLTPLSVGPALEHLREAGFRCEIRDPVWLFKAHRNDFFVDLITGMSNATLTVEPSWIERATKAVVFDVPTRVLAPEELLVSKLFVARRERFDGVDIAHIIYGTGGKLDWDRILQLVGEHWEMLLWSLVLFRYAYPGQTDYVPAVVWHRLILRFRDAVLAPDPSAKFRGSLVDDRMFAIDIREWGLHDLLSEYRARHLQKFAGLPGPGAC